MDIYDQIFMLFISFSENTEYGIHGMLPE